VHGTQRKIGLCHSRRGCYRIVGGHRKAPGITLIPMVTSSMDAWYLYGNRAALVIKKINGMPGGRRKACVHVFQYMCMRGIERRAVFERLVACKAWRSQKGRK
jgi:hypothetical protein